MHVCGGCIIIIIIIIIIASQHSDMVSDEQKLVLSENEVVVVWVAYHIAPFSTEFTQSQHIFDTVTGTIAITGSFWIVTDCEPAWSQL